MRARIRQRVRVSVNPRARALNRTCTEHVTLCENRTRHKLPLVLAMAYGGRVYGPDEGQVFLVWFPLFLSGF